MIIHNYTNDQLIIQLSNREINTIYQTLKASKTKDADNILTSFEILNCIAKQIPMNEYFNKEINCPEGCPGTLSRYDFPEMFANKNKSS